MLSAFFLACGILGVVGCGSHVDSVPAGSAAAAQTASFQVVATDGIVKSSTPYTLVLH